MTWPVQLLELLEDQIGDAQVVLEAATSLGRILQIAPTPTLKALDKHDAVTMLAYVIKRQQQLASCKVHFLHLRLGVQAQLQAMGNSDVRSKKLHVHLQRSSLQPVYLHGTEQPLVMQLLLYQCQYRCQGCLGSL